jgi:hypothetical protein
MGACDKLTFTNVDQTKFDCVAKAVNAKTGVPINGPTGTTSQGGYTVTWTFNAQQRSLTIQCLDSPGGVPCWGINRKIKGLCKDCGVQE